MTYGEASTSRTAIGSGLIYHGVREVSRHDLNKHLVLSFLTKQICCEYIWADVKHISIWNQGACIGLYFINKPEWVIVDHACSAYSYVSVPLYDTLGMFTTQNDYTIGLLVVHDLSSDSFCSFTFVLSGPDAVQFIVNHAAVEAIFCVPQTLSIVSFNHFSLSTFDNY